MFSLKCAFAFWTSDYEVMLSMLLWQGQRCTAGYLFHLLFCILAKSKDISGSVLTCDSAHSWLLDSAAAPGDQAVGNMPPCCTVPFMVVLLLGSANMVAISMV